MNCENQSPSIDLCDLNDLLYDLIVIHENDITGLAMKRLLLCIFNLIKNKNVNLSPKIFQKLISAMMAAFDEYEVAAFSLGHRQMVDNILACLKLQLTKFPSAETKLCLDQMCSVILNGDQLHSPAGQILDFLFENNFVDFGLERFADLIKIIQQLLQSKHQRDRQTAIFLMHKQVEINIPNNYIVALKHLEKQQMPLNLNDLLDNLKCVQDLSSWLRILFVKLFQSENISIVYETVKYVLNHMKMIDLAEQNLTEKFLVATNRTQLYNFDIEKRPISFFYDFLLRSEVRSDQIIEILTNFLWEWHSVPLCEWIKSMPAELEGSSRIDIELLLKLAARLNRLKNETFQRRAVDNIFHQIRATMESLSVEDYLLFIETIYDGKNYTYYNHDCLVKKIMGCSDFKTDLTHMTNVRLSKIFESVISSFASNYTIGNLISKLRMLPITRHGWLRFYLIDEIFTKEVNDFYYEGYNVYSYSINAFKSLKDLQKYFLRSLRCETIEEKFLCEEIVVDFFVTKRILSFIQIDEFHLNAMDLLKQGGRKTFIHLGRLLANHNNRLQDENVLSTFVALLKKFPECETAERLGIYASKHLTTEEQHRFSLDIIIYHIHHNLGVVRGILESKVKVPLYQVLKEIIYYSAAPTEDEWIETQYCPAFYKYLDICNWLLNYAQRHSDSYVNEVCNELLRLNKELSDKYPHYLANSIEHRLKIHIALALKIFQQKYNESDHIWQALLSSNDQLNVTLLFEIILYKTIPNLEILLERLQSIVSLAPNKQMFLLSVTNIFLDYHYKPVQEKQTEEIIDLLVLLTKGKDSQVRQFAKIVVKKITEKYMTKGFHNLTDNMNSTDEAKCPELQARLLLIDSRHWMNSIFWVYNMINMKPIEWPDWVDNTAVVIEFRRAIKSASIVSQHTTAECKIMLNNMSINNADLIVIAVLVDLDLSSLDDLIQTCSAFHVHTLIVRDSTNLSPKSVNTLNIELLKLESLSEYLYEKKFSNYNIVATQNTARNEDFVNFIFDERTILLLGHDQDGIPDNLKCFLDNTIEIPQNEFKHSQKLLIFKYYKQYLEN